jgi:hypothetical protein
MSEDARPWQAAREAWDRLEAWCRNPQVFAASPDEGDDALTALADGGLVRRLLDQIEFEAVRSARKHGRSWAEIAVRLGVTRQSAWERWRDVDDAATPLPAEDTVPPGTERSFEDDYDELQARMLTDPTGAAAEIADELAPEMFTDPAASSEIRRRAGGLSGAATAIVPTVIGMTRKRAVIMLNRVGLTGVGVGPDGLPLEAAGEPEDVVVDQSPEAGAKVPPGTTVMLWTDRRGGSGVREPRRPMPDPKTGRAMRDEATDEVVN